jgi:hypothetical protein
MRFFLTATVFVLAFLGLTVPASAEWVWPLRGQVITPYRNVDDPYAGGQHRGIDIAGPVGARVVAAAAGEVRFAATAGSSGLTVSVRTTDGFDTSYLHLSSASVREGEVVSAGDAVGAVGMTGSRSAAEPHLHFGVREAGTRHAYRNPLDFLPSPETPPAPDSPHPAPSPAPAPAPLAPVPAPVAEPGGVPAAGRAPRHVRVGDREPRRVPAGGREPRRVPAGGREPRRVPVDGRSPHRVPVGEPSAHPAPAIEPLPRHAPIGDADPSRLRLDGHAPRRAAPDGHGPPERVALGPVPTRAPAAQPTTHASPATGDQPARPSENAPGLDIGWILACVGLLLAAALLGLTEDGRKASRAGGSQLARLLRPLTGRG